jgi:RNA polymerase sigma-70 factor, ECF subfamily
VSLGPRPVPALVPPAPSPRLVARRAGGAPLPAREIDALAVHDAHADFVFRSLQRLGVRPADLDDVFQDVFVVVHKRLHTYDGSSKLTTWLYGICVKVAAAQRRRAWLRRETLVERLLDEGEVPSSDRPDALLAAREARATLDRVLDAMDLEKRAVFVMFEIDELSCEAIATILGVPVGTVWSRLSAARKQFEAKLARLQKEKGSTP